MYVCMYVCTYSSQKLTSSKKVHDSIMIEILLTYVRLCLTIINNESENASRTVLYVD